MRALLDGDILCFRSAAAAENEDEGIARHYFDRLLDEIVTAVGATSYTNYLTGKTNFRYQVYPEYKANRLDQYRPRHLAALRDYALAAGAKLSVDCEADDLMGVAQCATDEETIICTLDKDLLMIPGKHYSWEISGASKGTKWTKPAAFREVSEEDGLRWFYTQVLTGDVADNIKGAAGVGKVRAAKIIEGCESQADYIEACRAYFSCDEELEMTGACLWIWRRENDIWRIPTDTE